MKHLLIIFSLLLTSVSWSKDVDYNDLVKRDGLFYEKFTNQPFTGTTTGRHHGKFKDGKLEGEGLTYHDNGQLWIKQYHKDGKKEGEELSYYQNGQLHMKRNYMNGYIEGKWLTYNKNGKLEKTVIFKDGKLIETINH